jgi:hypothetical protein
MTEEKKKEYLGLLNKAAEIKGEAIGSQIAHKMVACAVLMDLAAIKDQKARDSILVKWMETPSSLGCNTSAFAQQLGLREEKKAKASKPTGGM